MKMYLVGGAVRDQLMGLESHDHDYVVVGATPADMTALGFTAETVGHSFPVFLDKNGDQYALARKEKKVGAGYHGFEVEFDPSVSLADDLFRRDLTVNAIAMDIETGEIADPYNGKADMEAKVLRHVSEAFAEDPLRVVRLARFFARWTDFTIAPNTEVMAKNIVQSGEMDSLSDERFWAEMEKVFTQGGNPFRFFEALFRFGALQRVRFFRDLFGDVSKGKFQTDFAAYTTSVSRMLTEADRSTVFTALAAMNAPQQSTAIPTRVKKLSENVEHVRHMHDRSAEKLFVLMAHNRAFDQNNNQIMDLVMALMVAEDAGAFFPIKGRTLLAAVGRTRAVGSSEFQHLKGKAIGEAMNAERMRQVEMVMESEDEG